jgi:hypothetical protein
MYKNNEQFPSLILQIFICLIITHNKIGNNIRNNFTRIFTDFLGLKIFSRYQPAVQNGNILPGYFARIFSQTFLYFKMSSNIQFGR